MMRASGHFRHASSSTGHFERRPGGRRDRGHRGAARRASLYVDRCARGAGRFRARRARWRSDCRRGRHVAGGPAGDLRGHIGAPSGFHLGADRKRHRRRGNARAVVATHRGWTPCRVRVEVEYPNAPGVPPIPWIVSNPIYVGTTAPHELTRPAGTPIVEARPLTWGPETGGDSIADVRPDALRGPASRSDSPLAPATAPISSRRHQHVRPPTCLFDARGLTLTVRKPPAAIHRTASRAR